MKTIVGIGACVFDTLITLPHYPAEDTKLRAVGTKTAGGGPTATGLVAAAKLGCPTAYIGVLAEDAGGQFLMADFEKYGVGTKTVCRKSGCRSFTSVIWLSGESKSRTCVFDKGDLPPLTLTPAQKDAIRDAGVLMIDGNETDAAEEACRYAKTVGTTVLYDAGGLYAGVERLLPLADILIPSEEFALGHTGADTAEEAAKRLYDRYSPKVVVVTRGSAGGVCYDGRELYTYPCYPVEVQDTNGAGDVFHGAFAAGIINGYDYKKCCHFASAVSALKCTGVGARESVPTLAQTENFLRENGYEL